MVAKCPDPSIGLFTSKGLRPLLLALVFAYLKFAKSLLVTAVLLKIGGGDMFNMSLPRPIGPGP
jgi:hypothetical protein